MSQTIIFQDGFDLYATASDLTLRYAFQTGTVQTTGGRFGGGSFQLNSGGTGLASAPFAATSDIWTTVAAQMFDFSKTGDRPAIMWTAGGSFYEAAITYNSTSGVWKAVNGSSTLLGTGTYLLTAGYHSIEARCVWSATVGVVELWIDGNQVLNITGAVTKITGAAPGMLNIIYGDGFNANTCTLQLDDLFIYTGTRLGDTRIDTEVPTSDTSPNDGTPSTGTNHWACVDEPQYNTSDYITMPNTSGDKEVYGHGSISSTPANVVSVQILLVTEKSDAGSFALKPLVISNGTEGDGSSQQLTTSWGIQSSIFPLDPHTSAAWTYANANAAAIGYKVT